MHLPNSSTSTSDLTPIPSPSSRWKSVIATLAWTLMGVVAADVSISVLFAMPKNLQQEPNKLQSYFEYGRSMESKMRSRVMATREASSPITTVGWLGDRSVYEDQPIVPQDPNDLMIATYGGSFSQRVARSIVEHHGNDITVRMVGAPGGPLNWAYAAYDDDRNHHQSQAAILVINDFNVVEQTLGGKFSDLPVPYTRPLFSLEDGKLHRRDPLIFSFDQLQTALLEDPMLWEKYCQQLAEFDSYYNPLLFRASVFDHSSLLRLLRRGYSLSFNNDKAAVFYDDLTGFEADSESLQVVFAIVREFAKSARSDDIIPIVYVVNTKSWNSNLFKVLKPVLEQNQIPYVSSHTFVSPSDPRMFLGDGHFIPEKDAEIGEAIVQRIYQELARSSVVKQP